jgi:hypothetical protein
MKKAILVIGLLVLLVCSGYGQTAIRVSIPFEFTAADTTLPAGTYELKPTILGDLVQIRNVDTGKLINAPVLTRLGTSGNGDPKVTFDMIGDNAILETIQPGVDDGYLFHVTKMKHTHKTVKIS